MKKDINSTKEGKQILANKIDPKKNVILCLIGTSGALDDKYLNNFISEVLTLKNSALSDSQQVILLSASNVLRGQIIDIDYSNLVTLVADGSFGRGGQDLAGTLDLAMNMLELENIVSIITLTDLTDIAPNKERYKKYLEKDIKFTFVIPNQSSQMFDDGVKDFANVHRFKNAGAVDLSKEIFSSLNSANNSRAAKLK